MATAAAVLYIATVYRPVIPGKPKGDPDGADVFGQPSTGPLPTPSPIEARRSDKERATDVPSWSKKYVRKPGESCDKFAERILGEHYGCDDPRAKERGPRSEYSKIKKHCERG